MNFLFKLRFFCLLRVFFYEILIVFFRGWALDLSWDFLFAFFFLQMESWFFLERLRFGEIWLEIFFSRFFFFDYSLFFLLFFFWDFFSSRFFKRFFWDFFEIFLWNPILLTKLLKQSGLCFLIEIFFYPLKLNYKHFGGHFEFFGGHFEFFFVDSWSTHKVVETKWSSFFHKLLQSALKVCVVVVVEDTNNHYHSSLNWVVLELSWELIKNPWHVLILIFNLYWLILLYNERFCTNILEQAEQTEPHSGR